MANVHAHLSPNCEGSGRRDYCANTPVAGATSEKQPFDIITFADHTVYEVMRTMQTCKMISEKIETCHPKIISPHQGTPSPYQRSRAELLMRGA